MGNSKLAFIVEDDKIAKSIIKNILDSNKRIGNCEFFENGLLALEKLKKIIENNELLPNFIILDFHMPIMNGLEFLESITCYEVANNIPVFIHSSSLEAKELTFFRHTNVKGNYPKPFTKHILDSILDFIDQY
jgi:two-component system, chemotaxis family, chemotaxis protein CheY